MKRLDIDVQQLLFQKHSHLQRNAIVLKISNRVLFIFLIILGIKSGKDIMLFHFVILSYIALLLGILWFFEQRSINSQIFNLEQTLFTNEGPEYEDVYIKTRYVKYQSYFSQKLLSLEPVIWLSLLLTELFFSFLSFQY